MILRTLRHSVKATAWIATALLVCAALLIAAGREFIGNIGDFKAPIEQWLSRESGFDVRLRNVSGEWLRASPEVFLSGVMIRDAAHPESAPADIDSVAVRLDIVRSLRTLTPRIRTTIAGASVRVAREESAWVVMGRRVPVSSAAPGTDASSVFSWAPLLLARPDITLVSGRIIVDNLYDRRTDLRVEDLSLHWRDDAAVLAGHVVVTGPDQLDIETRARIDVKSAAAGTFDATVYVASRQTRLSDWIPEGLKTGMPVNIGGGRGRMESWWHASNDGLYSATLSVDLHDLDVGESGQASFHLADAGGLMHWARDDKGGWWLSAKQLRLNNGEINWRPSSLLLQGSPANDGTRLRLTMADASVGPAIVSLVAGLPSMASRRELLAALDPQFRLQDIDVVGVMSREGFSIESGALRVRDLSVNPQAGNPGVTHAAVDLFYEPGRVWLSLDDHDLVLRYPGMLRDDVSFKSLSGALVVDWSLPGFAIRSGLLKAETPHMTGAARISIGVPEREKQPVDLAIQVALGGIDAVDAWRYLPVGLMEKPLVDWLDSALRGGTLTRGDVVVNGLFGGNATDIDSSVMLGFRVNEGAIRFLPDWEHPVEHLDADVIVDNGVVSAVAASGQYFGIALNNVSVVTRQDALLQNASQPLMHVVVHAEGNGPADQAIQMLRDTPLGKRLREPMSDASPEGELSTVFDLDAALDGVTPLEGKVHVVMADGGLRWPAHKLDIDQLGVDLEYDFRKGLSARMLEGVFLGQKISGQITTDQVKGRSSTRMELSGTAEVRSLAKWLDARWLRPASGETRVAMHWLFPAAGPGQVSITSTLDGVALDMPAPFGKTADSKRAIDLRYSLASRNARHQVKYGDVLNATWESGRKGVTRAAIVLGREPATLPAGEHIVVKGALKKLAGAEWIPLLDNIAGDTADPGNSTPAGYPWLKRLTGTQLHIDDFQPVDDSFGAVMISVLNREDGVQVQVDGEKLKGQVVVPGAWIERPADRAVDHPWSVNVQRIFLPRHETSGVPEPLVPPPSIDPRRLPAAQVRIDALRVGDEDYGRYQMQWLPNDQGVAIQALQFTLKTIEFSGQGQWEQRGGQAWTSLDGKGRFGDVSAVMSGFGYAPSMTSKKGWIKANLGWPGAPYQFAVARSSGKLKASLHNGRFLKVDNNAAKRVWGFLNFNTWMSRMQLQFDDLSSSEMPYDQVSGSVMMASNAVKVDHMKIDSPSLKMKMQGNVDLSSRRLDMQWDVTIPVTRNLMLPAVVVGGLPFAATAFVIDKVLGKQIDKLTTITYDVTGPFEEPEMKARIPL